MLMPDFASLTLLAEALMDRAKFRILGVNFRFMVVDYLIGRVSNLTRKESQARARGFEEFKR